MQHVSAADLLDTISRAPGPYLTAYLAVTGDGPRPTERFELRRDELRRSGATEAALDAVAARLGLPLTGDVGGIAVVAAADGSTIATSAPEPPREDLIVVGPVPRSGPMLEWDQWRVPHLVLTASAEMLEIARFTPSGEPSIRPAGFDEDDATTMCARIARKDRVPLIMVVGQTETAERLRAKLMAKAPLRTRIVTIDSQDLGAEHDLADTVVRLVADHVARATVDLLEEFRFHRGHDAVAEGAAAVVDWCNRGIGDDLLIHDDPNDERIVWLDDSGHTMSLTEDDGHHRAARLVDAVLHAAVTQRIDTRIIPSTAENGPTENIALVLRDPAVARSDVA